MELWIRSQDRKVLTQVKELYVTTYSEEKGYGIYDLPDEVDDTDVPLGFYKSKERALEVLDEIQNILKPITVFKNVEIDKETWETIQKVGVCAVNDKANIVHLDYFVYEMPKE